MPTTPQDSILNTIKKMLGVDLEDDGFDLEIITNINGVFMTLNQLGVGPTDCFSIDDQIATWDAFLGTAINLNAAKTFMYLKVKAVFDPQATGVVLDALNRQAEEIAWRLVTQTDNALYIPIPVVEGGGYDVIW